MKSLNIPESNLKRVVVVGGGFGGLKLVEKIDSNQFQTVLIDKRNYHTFQPLLYQVATAGLEPDSIAYPIRKIFKKKKNFYFRKTKAVEINSKEKTLLTEEGTVEYDYLILAMGSDTNYFGNEQIKKHSMPMKSVPEALDLRSLILENFEESLLTNDLAEREKLMNYVIVGGGPTGVELAGALAELKKHVLPRDYPDLDIRRMSIHLIEAGSRVLPALDESSSEKAFKYLQDLGVQVWLDTLVNSYDGQIVQTSNKNHQCSTLIWAAGVIGNTIDGINEASIVKGRYAVDENNKIINEDNIYAIGDIAIQKTEAKPDGDPMVAQTAIQQGELLAKNLKQLEKNKTQTPFVYNDKGSMATVGRNKAVAEIGKIRSSGIIAWLIWMFVHLMALVGFRNRMVALLNWSQSYFTYDKGIRLIIRPFKK